MQQLQFSQEREIRSVNYSIQDPLNSSALENGKDLDSIFLEGQGSLEPLVNDKCRSNYYEVRDGVYNHTPSSTQCKKGSLYISLQSLEWKQVSSTLRLLFRHHEKVRPSIIHTPFRINHYSFHYILNSTFISPNPPFTSYQLHALQPSSGNLHPPWPSTILGSRWLSRRRRLLRGSCLARSGGLQSRGLIGSSRLGRAGSLVDRRRSLLC